MKIKKLFNPKLKKKNKYLIEIKIKKLKYLF